VIFVGKARSLPKRREPERCSTQVGSVINTSIRFAFLMTSLDQSFQLGAFNEKGGLRQVSPHKKFFFVTDATRVFDQSPN